jgi:hypothetical protein
MLFPDLNAKRWILLLLLALITGCVPKQPITLTATPDTPQGAPTEKLIEKTPSPTVEVNPMNQTQFADVLSVEVTGTTGAYQFAVEISSPDTGCDQYADWWEVFTEDKLLYRRILLHSHVNERPFVRSGGPVDIDADTVVYVRGHMNTIGYGGMVMMGTVQDGFGPVEVEANFGSDLERIPPQPQDCAF